MTRQHQAAQVTLRGRLEAQALRMVHDGASLSQVVDRIGIPLPLLKLGPACGPCWEHTIRHDQVIRMARPSTVLTDTGRLP